MGSCTVTLPVGLDQGGVWQRTAQLAQWTGEIEMQVTAARGGSARERARALLLAALVEVGGEPVSSSMLDKLTMGDRDALLLHIRRQALGESMSAVVQCPVEACAQKLDVELLVSDLLAPPASNPAREHDVEVSEDEGSVVLRVRTPTVGDMEALAEPSTEDALSRLLRRCVLGVRDRGGHPQELPSSWPPLWVERISSAIEEHDPQAEIRIAVSCAHCGQPFESVLDVADYVTREVHRRTEQLLREVHTLALFYHWSEREILDLPATRRSFYLGLLAELTTARDEEGSFA
jgi:hypothetical protein